MGPLLVTRQESNLLVVHFIGRLSLKLNHALEVGQLYRSSDVRFSNGLLPLSRQRVAGVLTGLAE